MVIPKLSCSLMKVFIPFIFLVFSPLLFPLCHVNALLQTSFFDTIYQFGDSISDTGNLIRETRTIFGNPPYGQTYFHHPTGRCSDGLLMIDYIAQELQLPLLNPYLDKGGDFSHGVNFAVAGATALNISTLASKNITAGVTQSSLLVQIDWFKSHLSTICSNPSECSQKLEKALILLGEIGGNDYNSGAFEGKNMDVLRGLVPDVVQVIIDAATQVINLGGKRIVVPGNFPMGCMTVYLAAFRSDDPNAYDELKCLKSWNELAAYHNHQLQQAIKDLQGKHPDVAILYADYFSALQSVLSNAPSLGFDPNELLKACCGLGGGDYNYDPRNMCGSGRATVCLQPDKRVSWDGIHPTQHAYQLMAKFLSSKIIPSITNLA